MRACEQDPFCRHEKRAALINFARGPILEAGAMFEALETGQLSHAVLDVFNIEPLPESCPCWLHKHVTVLPHISAVTKPVSADIRRKLYLPDSTCFLSQ